MMKEVFFLDDEATGLCADDLSDWSRLSGRYMADGRAPASPREM
jgi:hypothetical protein